MPMRIVTVPQYIAGKENPAWVEWTLAGIGAPEAAAVLGTSRFDTPAAIGATKLGLSSRNLVRNPPGRGNRPVEDRLRAKLETQTGLMLMPICAELEEHPHVKGCFAGIAHDGTVAETRAPSEKVYGEVQQGGLDAVPEHVAYVKHLLLISGGPKGYLGFAGPGGKDDLVFEIALPVEEREQMLGVYAAFWKGIGEGEMPGLDPDRDIMHADGLDKDQIERWRKAEGELHAILADKAALEERLEKLKEREAAITKSLIKDMGTFMEAEVGNVHLTRFIRRGSVDYKAVVAKHLPTLPEAEIEAHRRKGTNQSTVTLIQP